MDNGSRTFRIGVSAGKFGGVIEFRRGTAAARDRKSTRLNSSHDQISYAVFCLKKKKFVRENLASYGYKFDPTDPDFLATLETASNSARDIETIATGEGQIEGRERDTVLECARI